VLVGPLPRCLLAWHKLQRPPARAVHCQHSSAALLRHTCAGKRDGQVLKPSTRPLTVADQCSPTAFFRHLQPAAPPIAMHGSFHFRKGVASTGLLQCLFCLYQVLFSSLVHVEVRYSELHFVFIASCGMVHARCGLKSPISQYD
jgi:hypothetical protein